MSPSLETTNMIAERFAKTMSLFPYKVAIDAGSIKLTYSDLQARADAFSQFLAKQAHDENIGEPKTVGIFAEHGVDAVIGVFATALAGWSYTPLDPRLELSELEDRLTASGVQLVLADQANMARALALPGVIVKALPLAGIRLEDAEEARLVDQAQIGVADHLAYILFTSGTSETPKAIGHNRASLLRSVDCYCGDSELKPSDKVSLVTPLWFTPSVFCIFGALLNGATLCPFDLTAEGHAPLGQWLKQQGVTLLYTTPTIFRRWASRVPKHMIGGSPQFPHLRMVQLAGEPLLASDVELFQKTFSDDVQLYNGMGTTQTSCAARFHIDHSMTFPDGCVPIGYPYADTDLVVRNKDGRMLGAGEIGDLYIVSGWTKAAIRSEFETGDLAMQDGGGRLVHFGRRGDRVRVAGVGVDLRELESRLMRHADIDEVAVILGQIDDTPHLIAFVSGGDNANVGIDELHDWMAQKLPEEMIPTGWVFVDALPILPAGKVDRKILQTQVPTQVSRDAARSRALDAVDICVLEAFGTVLGRADVTATTDFFAAGGDIESALDLVMAIERKLGTGLSVSRLIEAATPVNLAHEIRRQKANGHALENMVGLGAVWQLDHSAPLHMHEVDAGAIPKARQALLDHKQSMTATLAGWTGKDVSLNVLAQRQAGRYFMRKIELVCAPERTLAVAGIRIDLAAFGPLIRREIMAGDTPFGTILQRHKIQMKHRLQGFFSTAGEMPEYGRINRIEDDNSVLLAEVLEVLSSE